MTDAPLRVGRLAYINAIPFYGALRDDVQLVPGVPAHLNHLLHQGLLDISIISSFEYLSHPDLYDILPGFCIAAQDSVRSVHFYVKGSTDQLEGKKVALTAQSATSAQLVKIFCRNFWHVQPEFVPLPDLNSCMDYPGFLLIGDQALLHPGFPGYTRIDLATAWHEKTQLPMTFAVIAMRKGLMEERGDEVHALAKQFEASLQWAEANPDTVVQQAIEASHLPEHIVRPYYPLLHYRLEKPNLHSLRTFATLSQLPVPTQLDDLLCRF